MTPHSCDTKEGKWTLYKSEGVTSPSHIVWWLQRLWCQVYFSSPKFWGQSHKSRSKALVCHTHNFLSTQDTNNLTKFHTLLYHHQTRLYMFCHPSLRSHINVKGYTTSLLVQAIAVLLYNSLLTYVPGALCSTLKCMHFLQSCKMYSAYISPF